MTEKKASSSSSSPSSVPCEERQRLSEEGAVVGTALAQVTPQELLPAAPGQVIWMGDSRERTHLPSPAPEAGKDPAPANSTLCVPRAGTVPRVHNSQGSLMPPDSPSSALCWSPEHCDPREEQHTRLV